MPSSSDASRSRRCIPGQASEGTWQAQDGWTIRRIDLPATHQAVRGSILFLPGRADFYEKYLETLDHWRALGWNVTASDWRGQGDSGRLGNDRVTGHVDDFATWVDDLVWLWKQWSACMPRPHVLAAHSMGGHLALRAVAEGHIRPDGVMLSAPMLGFASGMLPMAIMHAGARMMCRLGDPRRPAWKWEQKPGQFPIGRANLLTHDAARYGDEQYWREQRPALVMGPGSWGWVERAYASMRGLRRPGMLEAVPVPVLIVATRGDRLVSWKAIKAACLRLPNCELVGFGKEASHEIWRECDPVRDRALAACDHFLGRIAAG